MATRKKTKEAVPEGSVNRPVTCPDCKQPFRLISLQFACDWDCKGIGKGTSSWLSHQWPAFDAGPQFREMAQQWLHDLDHLEGFDPLNAQYIANLRDLVARTKKGTDA